MKNLSKHKLLLVKRSLERYFIGSGVNIFLLKSLNSREVSLFRKKISSAIEKQILFLASVDKINLLTKKLEKLNSEILAGIALAWLAIDDILDQDNDINSFLYWAGNQGGQSALDKIVPDYKFNLTNQSILKSLDERSNFLVKTIDATTQKIIAQTIETAFKQGIQAEVIAKMLRGNARRIAGERADMITETELAYAMGYVETKAFEKNEISEHKWVTSSDEKVCQECMANEDVGYIDVGDEFPTGISSPPAHVFCRCFLIPKLPLVLTTEVWTGN